MSNFVVDASAALAWCFEDESSGYADGLLESLRHGSQIVVPAHWPTEVLNGLLVAVRRKRINADQPALLWQELSRLPIEVEPPLSANQGSEILALGDKFGLTVYDATYVELAQRRKLPLGTLDADLRKAAQASGVTLI